MSGEWTRLTAENGSLDDQPQPIRKYVSTFTADAADGSVPDLNIPDITGALTEVRVIFDDTDTPSSVALAVVSDGIDLMEGLSAETGSFMAELINPKLFVGGLTIQITTAGVADASTKGKVVVLIF